MAQAEPQLRVISVDEAPAVMTLLHKIGWNHSLEQIKQNITWGGKGSFCLAFDTEIVATAIAFKYSERLAWVGLVVSDQAYQRRGFARRLMNHVMQYLSSVESVMLDASVVGFPLYESMGFKSLYKINAYTCAPKYFELSNTIRPMKASDLPTVITMDADVFGLPRPQVINWLFETGKAFVVTGHDKVIGFTFVKWNADLLRLAAWTAPDAATAELLMQVGSNLALEGGYTYRIDVPEPNEQARDIVTRNGLSIERSVTRMVYGKTPPGHMSDQFGIVSFMTG